MRLAISNRIVLVLLAAVGFLAVAPAHSQDAGTDSEKAQTYLERYIVFFNRGRLDDADRNLMEALRLDPRNAVCWNNLGTLLHEVGRYTQALAAYDKAIALDPNWNLPQKNRARTVKARADVYAGRAWCPTKDLARLKAEDEAWKGSTLNFWLQHGKVVQIVYQDGDRQVTEHAVRISVPRKGLPLHVYMRIQAGKKIPAPIGRDTLVTCQSVSIGCKPDGVLLGESLDPFGVMQQAIAEHLAWRFRELPK